MKEYRELIEQFLKAGYKDDFFSQSPKKKQSLIIRHDIDFDIDYAHRMSLVEDELGVRSTYFFLLRSKSYNLFEMKNYKQIQSIKSRGHQVSIHFDPLLYDDIEKGFLKERQLFEELFETQVEYVSIHRPAKFFLNNPDQIAGINHTYQPLYFEEIKYFADSQGLFRYGHPCESEAFNNGDTIQLLIHPIWWVTQGEGNIPKLQEFLDYRLCEFKEHLMANCRPYKKFMEECS